jgi:hypothetical protein
MRFQAASLAFVLSAAALSVPAFGHGNDDNNAPVYLDRPLSASAEDTCTPGFLWQGAGNPNTTFQRKRNVDAGIELGIKGIVRQGPDIRSTYVDDNGLVHIEVPAGAQPGNPNRAAWNFTYSFDVSLDPGNPTLDSYSAELWIDLDPSSDTDYLKLTLTRLGSPAAAGPCPREPDTNGYGWKAKGISTPIIPDDEGTDRVTQNSQNLAFYAAQIDTNPRMRGIQPYTFGPGQFDVVLKIKRKTGWGSKNSETELHVVFDVVTAPSQTP